MAVFTEVTQDHLTNWLDNYDVGSLVSFKGISQGIENTNYFVETTQNNQSHHFVLTIFERLTQNELLYYLELMRLLAENHFPAPLPLKNNQGQMLQSLCDKPAALVTRLPGKSVLQATPEQCYQIGQTLAKLHGIGLSFRPSQPQTNPRGHTWRFNTAQKIATHLTDEQRSFLQQQIAKQLSCYENMSNSVRQSHCHCDLFMDNALFNEDQLGGVIDFYFAGLDHCIFDLAVCANDWCIRKDLSLDSKEYGTFIDENIRQLIAGYQSILPLNQAEKSVWPVMLEIAATRFWLSRLDDWYTPRDATLLKPHDPRHFEKILRFRTKHPAHIS